MSICLVLELRKSRRNSSISLTLRLRLFIVARLDSQNSETADLSSSESECFGIFLVMTSDELDSALDSLLWALFVDEDVSIVASVVGGSV